MTLAAAAPRAAALPVTALLWARDELGLTTQNRRFLRRAKTAKYHHFAWFDRVRGLTKIKPFSQYVPKETLSHELP